MPKDKVIKTVKSVADLSWASFSKDLHVGVISNSKLLFGVNVWMVDCPSAIRRMDWWAIHPQSTDNKCTNIDPK